MRSRTQSLDAPVLLTTDDESIAVEGRNLGWTVPFIRPPELSGDEATSVDAVLHLLDWRIAQGKSDPRMVMLLQTTSPLRGGESLAAAVALMEIKFQY